ncbi:bactofilin family protein [Marinobacterium sediminicola]|uniref:Protein CcmA, bactofilin family n=1 Tax=Marinobacterium sediminicola TaxID=518898 RepID=A0ABY1RX13_9GAMM|nr:polymer-forming cytoskeletal protein [Marinobacterium sediminicola]ULG67921.1 polymer-forming cytoskeletal protein [Marinobacterium sediminicola]SMR71369.1 protein CcmA, bactofilin family [Marinobacterium sediminicola]
MGILKRDVSAKSGRNAVTIIARGNHLSGDMRVSGKVHVDGVVEGRLEVTDDVTIGRHGVVRGFLTAQHVNVSGLIEGDVFCDSLHIERGGKVRARVCSEKLTIDPQGCFLGERHLQKATPRLEYHPDLTAEKEATGEVLDYALIDTLPDRITLSRGEG